METMQALVRALRAIGALGKLSSSAAMSDLAVSLDGKRSTAAGNPGDVLHVLAAQRILEKVGTYPNGCPREPGDAPSVCRRQSWV